MGARCIILPHRENMSANMPVLLNGFAFTTCMCRRQGLGSKASVRSLKSPTRPTLYSCRGLSWP